MIDDAARPEVDNGSVDADNPWPGLAAFREADRHFFRGRDASIDALTRLVLRSSVTVLHGVSGLGKTSLLQAGLFPRLRGEHLLPIYVRLVHDDDDRPLVEDLWDAVAAAAREAGVEAPPVPAGFTLWEYFHRKDIRFWDTRNRIVTPLIVLDQFEEVFTVGRASAERRARTEAFLADLSDLVAGRPAAHVRARLEHAPDEALLFSMTDRPCKVLFSLREDFLPDLTALRPQMPSVTDTMYRLQPMTPDEALRVVEAGGDLVEPDVAERIVRFVASARHDAGSEADTIVEPALLSVFCRELNNKRRAAGATHITADLLEGSSTAIIADFYERTVTAGGLAPAIRRFVEERLLTESGFRDSVAEEQALRTPGITQGAIDTLIGRRLLRRDDAGTRGRARLELTHDVLAGAVRVSRDQRRLHELELRALAERQAIEERARREAAERAAREQQQRDVETARALAEKERDAARLAQAVAVLERRLRRRQIAWLLALVAASTTLALFTWREARRASDAETLANRALSTADVARVGRGEPFALAYLARAVRTDPESVPARALLVSHLLHQVVPVADLAPGQPVRQVIVNRPGTHVLLLAQDGATRLWDVAAHDARDLSMPSAITTAVFSPDGTRVATASADGTVRVWHAGTVAPESDLAHDARVNSVAFSPTGAYVATGSDDQHLRIWNPSAGTHTSVRAALDPIIGVAFDSSGRYVLSLSSTGDASVWSTGEERDSPALGTRRGELAEVVDAAFSPDGHRLVAIHGDGSARVIDTASGRTTAAVLRDVSPFSSAVFDPTGSRVVTSAAVPDPDGGDAGMVVRVWDAVSGAPLHAGLSHDLWVNTVAFTTDGTQLVTASNDQTAQVWDMATGMPVGPRLRHARPVLSASFSPDGQRVITAAEDGTAQLWNARSGWAVGRPLRHEAPIRTAVFSRDGRRVLTASTDGGVTVWDAHTGAPSPVVIRHAEGLHIERAAFSADGRLLATAARLDQTLPNDERERRRLDEGLVQLWDVPTGDLVGRRMEHAAAVTDLDYRPAGAPRLLTASADHTARLWEADGTPSGTALTHDGPVFAAAFSPDGRQAATASADGTARLWRVDTSQPEGPPLVHDTAVMSVAFTRDAGRVATGTVDGAVHLWDVRARRDTSWPAHDGPVTSVTFSADDHYLLSSSDGDSRIWRVADRQPVGGPVPHSGARQPPAFSPDGTSLVSASAADVAGVWDVTRPIPVLRWGPGTDEAVVAAAFSGDGRVVTASDDGTARVWHARVRQEVSLPLRHGASLQRVLFSPDNTRLASVAADGAARLWDVPAGTADDRAMLALLAETLGGHVVDADGSVARVADRHRRLDDLERDHHDAEGTAWCTRLTRWLLAEPTTRAASPWTSATP